MYTLSYFGHTSNPSIASSLSCAGSEQSLLDCSYDSSYALLNCGDGSVAGIKCLSNQY